LQQRFIRKSEYFALASASLLHRAEDDATMADTVEQVAERLAQLEVTVAKGFHEMDQRLLTMTGKIDIITESLRSDMQSVASTVTTFADEMRRTTDAIRQEHVADREVLRQSLVNHGERIHVIERAGRER
jgi:hypothetical protein